MKQLIFAMVCLAMIGSTAYAANIDVASGSSIQTAINSAADGDTITLTSSAVYKGNLRINKSIKLVAAIGTNPKIEQADNTTTAPVILAGASPVTIKLGSPAGGRLTFQYLKWGVANTATLPSGMIRIDSPAGSAVTIENCDIITTGTDTYGYPSGICHGLNPVNVTIRNTNINLNRGNYTAGGDSANRMAAHGIDISNNGATSGAPVTGTTPGPVYTLDHVRIKGFLRSGLWLHYTSMTLQASYIDVGTVGESAVCGTATMPWGPLVAFNKAATWTGRIDHSIFQGPSNYAAFGSIGGDGTSITLSRCVFLGKGATTAYPTILAGLATTNGTAVSPNPSRLTLDHCDVISLAASGAGSAIYKNYANSVVKLTVKNTNIYSTATQAVNFVIAGADQFTSSYNNVFGSGANVGYTAGTGDKSKDPGYNNPRNGDVRYSDNELKRSDENGGAIGVNADYRDPVAGITLGEGPVNRAQLGWTTLK